MAANILLKIAGVTGDSKIDGHEGEIDVLSASLGATNPSSRAHGGGAGTAKVNVHDLMITKRADAASPELFLKTCDGTHYEDATLVFCKAGGDGGPVEYLKYEMTHVFVSSWQQSGGGDQFAMENVALSMEKLKVTFTGQDDTGAPTEPVEVEWDIAANKKP
jgi:type VI secretion system secreted protein Hcp